MFPGFGVSCLTGAGGSGRLYRVDSDDRPLVHLCDTQSWADAQQRGELTPQPDIGFIHLSTPEQVHLPADRLYRGRADLLLLHVAPGRLASPLRWEPGVQTDPVAEKFPHLYGPLPVAAVVAVTEYRPGPDGVFEPLTGRDASTRGG